MSVVDTGNGGGDDVVAGNKFCALSTCGATRKVRWKSGTLSSHFHSTVISIAELIHQCSDYLVEGFGSNSMAFENCWVQHTKLIQTDDKSRHGSLTTPDHDHFEQSDPWSSSHRATVSMPFWLDMVSRSWLTVIYRKGGAAERLNVAEPGSFTKPEASCVHTLLRRE